MKWRKIIYAIPMLVLLILAKFGTGASKSTKKAFILEADNRVSKINSHSSHAAHSSHISHYSCTLISADSIDSLTSNQRHIIRESLNSTDELLLKSFISKATIECDNFEDRYDFNDRAICLVTRKAGLDVYGNPGYYINVTAIPISSTSRNAYYFTKWFTSIEQCDTYISLMGSNFITTQKRLGGRIPKKEWMYNL